MKNIIPKILIPALAVTILSGCAGNQKNPNVVTIDYKIEYVDPVDEKRQMSNNCSFTFNFEDFVNAQNVKMSQSIATLDLLMCADSYPSSFTSSLIYLNKDGEYVNDKTSTYFIKEIGAKDIVTLDLKDNNYEEDECDTNHLQMFHFDFNVNGTLYQVFNLLFVGTYPSASEWKSNCDFGRYNSIYCNEDHPHTEWKNKNTHKGFDITAGRSYTEFKKYVNSHNNPDAIKIMNYTGHSRGGGIANIFAKYYNDFGFKTFAYTFACPNTTTETTKLLCPGLFNFINKGDMITYAPCHENGFYRYGTDISFAGIDLKNKFFELFGSSVAYLEPGYQALKEMLIELLDHIDNVYVQPDIEGELEFDTREEAQEFIDEKKEVVDYVNKEYALCLILDENIVEDDDSFIVKYTYSRAIYLNALYLVFDFDIETLLELSDFLGSFIEAALEYVPEILANGPQGIVRAHMPFIYLIYLQNYVAE